MTMNSSSLSCTHSWTNIESSLIQRHDIELILIKHCFNDVFYLEPFSKKKKKKKKKRKIFLYFNKTQCKEYAL